MATTKVKGGFKVKKKDGTLGKTVFKTQKAAQSRARGPGKKGRKAPARRKPAARKAPARKRSRSVAKKGNPSNRSKKIGAVLREVRTADVVSGPAQAALVRGNAGDIPRRYVGQFAGGSQADMLTTAKAVGVGIIRNVITSKAGAYRGISQNKILSYAQALAPEIVASAHANPLTDPRGFNEQRHLANEGYDGPQHSFNAGASQLRDSVILQLAAWGTQKVAQKLGVNKMLPKGVNL